MNKNSRVCSKHFNRSHLRKLRPDEYSTEHLTKLATRVTTATPRSLLRRLLQENEDDESDDNDRIEEPPTREIGVNTEDDQQMKQLKAKVCELEEIRKHESCRFSLESIASDDSKVAFYTGFPAYDHLKICFDFLGPAASQLIYRDSRRVLEHSNKGRPRSLPPMEEFFLTLVRLRLGLLEQDIAYRFGISQSTVSRIFTSWINFMHIQFQQIPLWPPREFVHGHMPALLKRSIQQHR